jgi:hypothetical protein
MKRRRPIDDLIDAHLWMSRGYLHGGFKMLTQAQQTLVDKLDAHVMAIAKPYGLIATAKEFTATPSDTSTAGLHVRVSVYKPPLENSGIYTIRQLERDGATFADDFVKKACEDLATLPAP